MAKSPTPGLLFEELTAIVPEVLVVVVHEATRISLSQEEQEWLKEHVSLRLRYLHANRESYRETFEGVMGRDYAYRWVKHWFRAFETDRSGYRRKHPNEAMQPGKGSA